MHLINEIEKVCDPVCQHAYFPAMIEFVLKLY